MASEKATDCSIEASDEYRISYEVFNTFFNEFHKHTNNLKNICEIFDV